MPSVTDDYLDSVVYLYPTREAAESGEKVGGSGFLVYRPSSPGVLPLVYAVSNKHVVSSAMGNSPVVRLNTHDGSTSVFELSEENWVPHPDGDDVAVALIGPEPSLQRFMPIPVASFAQEGGEWAKEHPVAPGDDVFMLGRFIGHDGKQRNKPVIRFGHVAMLPEPIRTPYGTDQLSFLVEALSLSGFSGSPVFSYQGRVTWGGAIGAGGWLLGVDWGHVPQRQPVRDPTRAEPDNRVEEKWYVNQNSGFLGVVPAWKITETLDTEEVQAMSKKYLQEVADESAGEFDSKQPGEDEFERFEDLTRKLVQVPKKELDEKRREDG